MTERRRQSRGLARIEAILDAATVVIAREGVDRATTNAIAAQAGISPGSLYQFFADKLAICDALATRYADGLAAVHASAMAGVDPLTLDTAVLVDRLVEPVVAYKSANLAFVPLFGRTDLPALGALREANERFEDEIVTLLRARNPERDPAEVETAAGMVFVMVRGSLAALGDISGDQRSDTAELKTAILAYLRAKGLA